MPLKIDISQISSVEALALMCLVGGFVWALIETRIAIWFAHRMGMLAPVNERSAHREPTPTIGGLAIADGILIFAILLNLMPRVEPSLFYPLGTNAQACNWLLIAAGAVMALMGFVDDWKIVLPAPKLAIQMLCALVPAWLFRHGEWFGEGPMMTFALNFVWVMVITNIFNFMDGMDGFAGLFTVTVAGTLAALVAYQVDDLGLYLALGEVLFIGLALVGLTLGFLFYNLPPAMTFMGDVGSQFIGWLLGTLTLMAHVPLKGIDDGQMIFPAAWGGLLLLLPFLGDGVFTMIRRARKGENIFRPHFSHLYQRLMKTGLTHRAVLFIEAPVIIGCAALTFALMVVRPSLQPLLGVAGLLLMVGLWLRVRAEETKGEQEDYPPSQDSHPQI